MLLPLWVTQNRQHAGDSRRKWHCYPRGLCSWRHRQISPAQDGIWPSCLPPSLNPTEAAFHLTNHRRDLWLHGCASVLSALPVCRTSRPDVGDHKGAGLVPVLMGTTCKKSKTLNLRDLCKHNIFISVLHTIPWQQHVNRDFRQSSETNRKWLILLAVTSHDETKAAPLFVQTDVDCLRYNPWGAVWCFEKGHRETGRLYSLQWKMGKNTETAVKADSVMTFFIQSLM